LNRLVYLITSAVLGLQQANSEKSVAETFGGAWLSLVDHGVRDTASTQSAPDHAASFVSSSSKVSSPDGHPKLHNQEIKFFDSSPDRSRCAIRVLQQSIKREDDDSSKQRAQRRRQKVTK